ncbi:uncharacterized protein BKA78DRAFT_306781 [Phyllosticta capitalensis]|uniref:uncharacterized protein n=1 Tax=Phyllosticta capitalensis TaxID=121624 RepID=UPI00312D65EC
MPDSDTPSNSDTPPNSTASKPKKRSFFKKPSWQTTTENDDPTALFDHSRQTISAIQAEEERKRKEEEERKREQELVVRRKKEQHERELEEQREGKRRRISHDPEDNDLADFGVSATEGYRTKSESSFDGTKPATLSSSPPTKRSSTSLSSRYEEISKRSESIAAGPSGNDDTHIGVLGTPTKDPVIIDLDDSDSAEDVTRAETKEDAQAKQDDPDDDPDESDPEVREILRKSRRKKRLAEEQRAMATPPIAGLERQGSASSLGAGTPLPPNQSDPPIQILIEPRIANTKPLLVTRRLSQRLKEVREAWCKRQGFDEETTQSIFLTHRGIRLYDVATSKVLGFSLNSEGELVNKFNSSHWDEDINKVVLQATTKEIYEADKQESRRKLEGQPSPEPEPEPEEKQIRVVIKTKEHGDCRFIVRPSTEFGKMTNSARIRMKLPTHLKPYLCFDGERLDPDGTMADFEDFDDGDAIDMFFE